MLAYILALIIALASLTLYLAAFFLPKLHRKDDFLWSSVGLFYALVLWVCAGRITGGVLLGQTASVALVISFGWQTVKLRRMLAHPADQTSLEGFSVITWLQTRFSGKKKTPVVKSQPQASVIEPSQAEKIAQETPESGTLTPEIEPASSVETITQTVESVTEEREESAEIIESLTDLIEEKIPESVEETSATIIEAVTENPSPTTKAPKKGFSFKNLFGFGKAKPNPSSQKSSITTALEEIDRESKRETTEEDWEDEGEISETVTLETSPILTAEITTPEMETTSEVLDAIDEEKEAQISETVTLETSPILAAEIATPEGEITSEVLDKIDEELDFAAEFEPFIGDNESETIIEDYQPISKSSSAPDNLEVTETQVKNQVEEVKDEVKIEPQEQS